MSTIKAPSKKRKREPSPPKSLVFRLSTHTQGEVGPVLVSFPALQAPATTAFKCYARKNKKPKTSDEDDTDIKDHLIVGETDNVEFVSNEDETRRVADGGCRYLIAVHNRRTSSLTLLPTPTSPHILTHTVKALKSIPPTPAPTAVQFTEARNALGETFGTKKAKANIRAQERNRVDVSAMEGVMDYLMDGIDKGAEGLMTKDEAKETTDNNRLIPPFSLTATDPADIYPLHDIIPEAEWKALSVSAFDNAGSANERKGLLPFRWSKWANAHLEILAHEPEHKKKRKKDLKILLYISAMLAFRRATEKKTLPKEEVHKKLTGVPGVVVDGLLARFTEVSRGSTGHQSTTATQSNLLTHIFALCLKVDNYATDFGILAQDLSLSNQQVRPLFKSLGCKIKILSGRERAQLGIPDSTARHLRAVLEAPVEFPKPRLRRK